MKLPLSWLSDYTDVSGISAKEYSHLMTMSGSKVEGFINKGEGIENIVTGKILKIEKHPDADKLKICSVDVKNEILQIVTGAPNVQEGDIIPVALVDAKLPGGIRIKKSKLRGVDSFGMMCSTDELAITENEATGVMILDLKTPLGSDIKEVLSLNDSVIEFEITSNRPDCLSAIGIARETAATLDRSFSIPKIEIQNESENISDYIKVRVENKQLCPRYTARVIKNVKIKESPDWLKKRLMDCGVRAINTIVDITNYVMLEYGQPMHAFDIRDLEGREIIVQNAKDGEVMKTLDGIERNLSSEMLMIRDAKKPVAVAGVMGGENSEIKDDTTIVVFESANFFGPSVRKTAQKLGLRTEASARFEKGLDPDMTVSAVNRACELVEKIGAGEVVGGIIDCDYSDKKPHEIEFRPDRINAFLGTRISRETMTEILDKFEFKIEGNTVLVPSFRADVEGEADISEEIARIYGYNKIESTPLTGETTIGEKNEKQRLYDKIMETLTACGLYEIMSYSFTNSKMYDALLIPEDSNLRKCVKILNPLGEENSLMRTTTLIGMLETLSLNYSQRVESAALFEIGRVYLPKENASELPDEQDIVTIGKYGDTDFYDIKGIVEELLDTVGIEKYKVIPVNDNPTYHPGKTARIAIGNQTLAVFGEVHPAVLENLEIKVPVYTAEINFNYLLKFSKKEKKFKSLPKYPAVSRDIAVLVDENVMVGRIEEIIRKNSGAFLEQMQLFDVYKGKQIPENKKSVAYSFTLRADDHTLKEDEINNIMDKIVKSLSKNLDAQLRV